MKNLLETESLPNVRILFQQMKDSIITNFNSIYIKGSTPISWSSSGGQRERERETERERERERKREEESTLLWLSSLARVRLHLRCFGFFFFFLRAVLNKSWRQHPTRLQLYGHLPPITKTIQVRRTRHAGHCWRSKDELISDVLLWTPTHGCARVGRPARTYIQQLCEDTGCNPEDLPEAMNDREKWRETVRDIRAGGAT